VFFFFNNFPFSYQSLPKSSPPRISKIPVTYWTFLIETLETRRSDSLDFHDVAVWCLRDALEAAFNAGLEQGRNANPSDKANT
jgi:hypothetical protein